MHKPIALRTDEASTQTIKLSPRLHAHTRDKISTANGSTYALSHIYLPQMPVGELRNQKSVVNFEQNGCVFYLHAEQKFLGGLSPIFFRW